MYIYIYICKFVYFGIKFFIFYTLFLNDIKIGFFIKSLILEVDFINTKDEKIDKIVTKIKLTKLIHGSLSIPILLYKIGKNIKNTPWIKYIYKLTSLNVLEFFLRIKISSYFLSKVRIYINNIGAKNNSAIDVQLSLGISKYLSVKLSIVNNKNNIKLIIKLFLILNSKLNLFIPIPITINIIPQEKLLNISPNNKKYIKNARACMKRGKALEILVHPKTYKKIVSEEVEKDISKKEVQDNIRRYLKSVLNRKPDIYNGYKSLDLEKVENIISYIASKVKNLTITSLNKYLWYIDMLSFNKRAVAITGLTYQNQKFGPTIVYKKYDELSLLDDKYQREDIETENGNTTKIISNNNFNLDKISSSEKEIIDTIIKLLKNKNVTDISEMSHREDGWKKTKRFEQISFEYAMNLKLI